ncbi:MAG: hypothetical protein IKR61_06985 [Lachnospiraceae bacterium]|nr:hypothetical protein [Lachnospiraceae bacterium]
MRLFVKETDTFTISKISVLLYDNVEIKPFVDIEEVLPPDYIVISEDDCTIQAEVMKDYHVIVYEKIIKSITKNIYDEYQYRHDYYYLLYALNDAYSANITTLISGSSYGALGIDSIELKNSVNLSSISQDLYYSVELIKKVCDKNLNIQNIIICAMYYFLFCDLSLTQNMDELQRISKVYYPLLGDMHNCFFCPPALDIKIDSEYIDIDNILLKFFYDDYKKGFVSDDRPRADYACKLWEDQSKDWHGLTEYERREACRLRAESHNSNIKDSHLATLRENINILQDLTYYCADRGINLVMVVPPVSKDYLSFLEPGFKECFYKTLEDLDGIVHVVDMSEDPDFDDVTDMNDMDHLGDSGAIKFTKKINELIQSI